MMKDTCTVYDYKSSWGRYAFEDEENRFLSSDEKDLLKICDCIDLSGEVFKKTSGGIPVHYSNDKIKEPHVFRFARWFGFIRITPYAASFLERK